MVTLPMTLSNPNHQKSSLISNSGPSLISSEQVKLDNSDLVCILTAETVTFNKKLCYCRGLHDVLC